MKKRTYAMPTVKTVEFKVEVGSQLSDQSTVTHDGIFHFSGDRQMTASGQTNYVWKEKEGDSWLFE